MSNVAYLRPPTPEEVLLVRRGEVTRRTHDLVRQGGQSLRLLPDHIRDALKCEAWKDRVTPNGAAIANVSFLDWVTAPFPRGIEADVDIVRKLIAGDAAALVAFDEATHRSAGRPAKTLHNVQGSTSPEAPTGNTAGAAIRRLRKAADAGDAKAVDLLAQVVAGTVKPNRAAILMGWKRAAVTVPDDPAAFFDGLVKRITPAEIGARLVESVPPAERPHLLAAIVTAGWKPRPRRRRLVNEGQFEFWETARSAGGEGDDDD